MILPLYRVWVIVASVVVCFGTWFVIERTRLGATLRAATENAPLLQAFGVNVPRLVAATYGAAWRWPLSQAYWRRRWCW